jgi:hypothetical protein
MSKHFTKTMISILKNGIPSDDLPKNLAPSGYVQNVEDWMSHINASDGNPSKEKFRQMCDFLSQHIGANFAPENIENIDELLSNPTDTEAKSVRVISFQFDQGMIIPSITVESIFQLNFHKDISQVEIGKWESNNDDPLSWCLNYYWHFDEVDDDEWEGYLDTNEGVSLRLQS